MAFPKCPHITAGGDEQGLVVCAKLSEFVGYGLAAHEGICEQHMKGGGSDVPVGDVPALRRFMKNALCARLGHGDCPKYQTSNPINFEAAAALAKTLCTPEERERIFLPIVDEWEDIGEEHGGHPARVIRRQALRLAEIWDIDLGREIEAE